MTNVRKAKILVKLTESQFQQIRAEAGHSFFNPIRPGYHAASAEAAGERLEALIERTFVAATT